LWYEKFLLAGPLFLATYSGANANLALQAVPRGYFLEIGEVTLEDKADALLHNPEIRKACLGE